MDFCSLHKKTKHMYQHIYINRKENNNNKKAQNKEITMQHRAKHLLMCSC